MALQTTNLGVRSSNLFGRAIFWQFPCDSHAFTRLDEQGAACYEDVALIS
jgi:hypothetical protein